MQPDSPSANENNSSTEQALQYDRESSSMLSPCRGSKAIVAEKFLLDLAARRYHGPVARLRSHEKLCCFMLEKEAREMNYLVTGGRGMLGREFARELAGMPNARHFAPGKYQLDVRDESAMNAAAKHAEGGWLIHCAAMVSVEDCARDPDTAREIIVDGTRRAITTAKSAGARLFYPQSFLTHDGRVNPIAEEEEQRPLSLYGKLKWTLSTWLRRLSETVLSLCVWPAFSAERKPTRTLSVESFPSCMRRSFAANVPSRWVIACGSQRGRAT